MIHRADFVNQCFLLKNKRAGAPFCGYLPKEQSAALQQLASHQGQKMHSMPSIIPCGRGEVDDIGAIDGGWEWELLHMFGGR